MIYLTVDVFEDIVLKQRSKVLCLSSPVNCSFISCRADTAVLGSMYSAECYGVCLFTLFGLPCCHLCWWWQGQRNLASTRNCGVSSDAFYCLGEGQDSLLHLPGHCLQLMSWAVDCHPHSTAWLSLSGFQEQLRQRARPLIRSLLCWEGELGDREDVLDHPCDAWLVFWWCSQQPELQPQLLCSVPRALSQVLPSREHSVLLQVTQSV